MGFNKKPKEIQVREEPWGSGWILEDIWLDDVDKYGSWEPHVQAIKNERGDLALRFCYYKRKPDGTRGRFVNSAMFVYDWTMDDLREESKINNAHIILSLFERLSK